MKNKRKLYIILGLAAAIIVIGLVSLQLNRQSTNESSTEPIAEQQPQAQYLNAGDLITIGVTAEQLEAMKEGFKQFKTDAKQIVIFSDSVAKQPRNPSSDVFTVRFTVTVDNVTYQALLEYFELDSVRLHLDDQSGKRVFDSSTIKR